LTTLKQLLWMKQCADIPGKRRYLVKFSLYDSINTMVFSSFILHLT
jgi:hypothetical protein